MRVPTSNSPSASAMKPVSEMLSTLRLETFAAKLADARADLDRMAGHSPPVARDHALLRSAP